MLSIDFCLPIPAPLYFFPLLVSPNPLIVFILPTFLSGALWLSWTGLMRCEDLLPRLFSSLMRKVWGSGLAGLGHIHTLILVFWLTVLRIEHLLNELIITAAVLGEKRWNRNMSSESLVFAIICVIVTPLKRNYFSKIDIWQR